MYISDVITTKSGRTFKNGIIEHVDPTHHVIQLRDVDTSVIQWDRLIGVNIETNRDVKSLEEGQILMVAKGPTKRAVIVASPKYKNTVATQHFLVLAIKNIDTLLPRFVTFYLNSAPVQQWLNGNAGGSYQSSLSINRLSKLPFPNISVKQQQKILHGVDNVEYEISIHELLIKQRKNQLNEIAGVLLSK